MTPSIYHPIFRESPYDEVVQKQINGRLVCKYKFIDDSENGLDRAADAIGNLFRHHPNLIPTFPKENRMELIRGIQENNYLIINGRAVSLAPLEEGDNRAARSFIDKLFSDNFLEQPIKCTGCSHYFEKRRLEFWKARAGSKCPFDEEHDLPDALEIDDELVQEIRSFKLFIDFHDDMAKKLELIHEAQRVAVEGRIVIGRNLERAHEHERRLQEASVGYTTNVALGVSKCVFKAGAKEVKKREPLDFKLRDLVR